jgi:hypothetical protein
VRPVWNVNALPAYRHVNENARTPPRLSTSVFSCCRRCTSSTNVTAQLQRKVVEGVEYPTTNRCVSAGPCMHRNVRTCSGEG